MRVGKFLFSAGLMVQLALAPAALAQQSNQKTAKVENPDKIICKKYPVLGSLTQVRKVCHTRAEWRRLTDNAQEDVEAMQTTKSLKTSN